MVSIFLLKKLNYIKLLTLYKHKPIKPAPCYFAYSTKRKESEGDEFEREIETAIQKENIMDSYSNNFQYSYFDVFELFTSFVSPADKRANESDCESGTGEFRHSF